MGATGRYRSADARAVRGHTRPSAWRSIRVRIMLPVLVATIGVVVLGAKQITDALTVAGQADRASTLAGASGTIGSLAHEVGYEYVLSSRTGRMGRPAQALADQQARTDLARQDFAGANRTVRQAAPDVVRLSDAAERALTGLDYARTIAEQSPDGGTAEVRAFYDEMLKSLLALADALPAQMIDKRLIELSRSVALVAELDRLAALQLDLITRGLINRALPAGDPILLAEWVGGERKQVETLTNLRPGGDLYARLTSQSAVAVATSIRQVILDGQGGQAALTFDVGGWFDSQSRRLQGLWEIEQHLAVTLYREATALGAAARGRTYLTGGLSAAVVAVTLVGATVMAVRTSRRLRRTRQAALTAARIELPTAISNVTAAHDAGMVRAALTDSSARIDSMLNVGRLDEVGELATAFGAVHRQALRLAADQALLRMEVQAIFVALSRRGQTLIQRQIHLIDEFGRDETDPDALARLFALDHLAARMRRNEENLLVLAGGEPGRWITRPVAMIDLLRAAAQEIEEYRRVEIVEVPAVAISAHVAGDAIHLLAELFENATSFSPPHTTVRVVAHRRADGLVITAADAGIGMPPAKVAEANDRLDRASALTSTLVGTMGLLVVARLAQRHGVRVRLDSIPAGGTTATVLLPDRLIVPITAEDQLQPARRMPGDGSARELPVPAAAVTSIPPSPTPRSPTPRSPTPRSPTLPRPVPAQRTPQPVRPVAPDLTPAGLPRRPSDEPPAPDPFPGLPQRTPDPEIIRARLSSLASGIAAANQPEAVPPPAAPRSQ